MADTKQLLIQRLVDGELDRQQVRKLLHQAESESPMYRQIALAMVENQIWQREVCQLDSRMAGGESEAVAAPASSVHSNSAPVRSATHFDENPDHDGAHSWRWGQSLLALAVVALLMTWLGYSAGQWRSSIGRGADGFVQGASGNTAPDRMAAAPGTDVKQTNEDPYAQYSPYRMQMVSNDTGLKSDEEFPVLPISTARELGVKYESIPPSGDLQRRLNRQGYELEPEIQYIRVQMDDGRQIIVPVQRMQLKQWGQ